MTNNDDKIKEKIKEIWHNQDWNEISFGIECYQKAKEDERKRIIKIIEDLECKSKLHKKNPCREHNKMIDVEELIKEIQNNEQIFNNNTTRK